MRITFKNYCQMALFIVVLGIISFSSQPILIASSKTQSSQKDPIAWMKELDMDMQQMVIDHDDSVCLAGSYNGKFEFHPETNEIKKTPNANKDIPANTYLIKFDSSGRLEWGAEINHGGYLSINDMKIDDANSVYLCGTFEKRINFSATQSSSELTSDKYQAVFICKFNKNGRYVWSGKWENTDTSSNVWKIALDQNQNIYIAGAGMGGLDLDPGPGEAILPLSEDKWGTRTYTSFLCKFDTDKNFKWLKGWNAFDSTIPLFNDVKIDSIGRVYLTGSFEGTHDFDPNEGIQLKTGRSYPDIYLLVLDLDGNFKSVLTFGGSGLDSPDGIRIDKDNNVYLFGKFSDKVDFDPGPGVAYRRAKSGRTFYGDVFILKLDSSLNYKWVNTWGGREFIQTRIFIDNSGNVYELANDYSYSSPETMDWKIDNRFAAFIRKYDKNGKFKGACTWFDNTKTGVLFMDVDSKGAFYVYGARPSYSLMKISSLEFSKDAKAFSDLPDKTSEFKRFVKSFEGSVKTVHEEKGSCWKVKSSGDFEIHVVNVHVSSNNDIYVVGYVSMKNSDFYNVDFMGKWDSKGNRCWLKIWDDTSLGASKIVTDKKGNVYVTGLFSGTVDFDPGPDVYEVTSFNSKDYFVCKFDSNARLKWVTMIAKERSFTEPMSMVIDKDANLYLGSMFGENFYPNLRGEKPYDDPGTPVKANLVKIDSNGSILWFKQTIPDESEGLSDIRVNINDLTLDDRKGILLSGYFSGKKDTGKSEKDELKNIVHYYVANFDLKGNLSSSWVWTTSQSMEISKCIFAPDGSIYITGNFAGEMDFDPGPGTMLVESNSKYIQPTLENFEHYVRDAFLMKLSGSGKFEWVKSWGQSQVGYVKEMRFLNDNPVTNFILNPPDDRYLWMLPAGDESIVASDMVSTNNGAIFIMGGFEGIIDFDPDKSRVYQMVSGILFFSSISLFAGPDIPPEIPEKGIAYHSATFISKFGNDGIFQKAIRIPGFLDTINNKGLAIDSHGDLYAILNSDGNISLNDADKAFYPLKEAEEFKDVFLIKIQSSTFLH